MQTPPRPLDILGDLARHLQPPEVPDFIVVGLRVRAGEQAHVAERAAMAGGKMGGVAPKPLDAGQASELIEEIKAASAGDANADQLVELLSHRVPPGVDEAAYVKAGFLAAITKGEASSPLITCMQESTQAHRDPARPAI